jgi:hypothetical protein
VKIKLKKKWIENSKREEGMLISTFQDVVATKEHRHTEEEVGRKSSSLSAISFIIPSL